MDGRVTGQSRKARKRREHRAPEGMGYSRFTQKPFLARIETKENNKEILSHHFENNFLAFT